MTSEVIKTKGVSLASLLGGAAIDMFDEELRKVGENITDTNTEAEQVRKVVLTCELKPHSSREISELSIKVESKLAGDKAQKGSLFVMRTAQGKTVLSEKNAKQMDIEEEVARVKAADVKRVALATGPDED